jgi:hypothetical protein
MGTGTDVAMESTGITLLKGDLMGMVRAQTVSCATMRNIRKNLFLSFAYNVAGIPLAAGVLYPFFGLLLSPVVAAARWRCRRWASSETRCGCGRRRWSEDDDIAQVLKLCPTARRTLLFSATYPQGVAELTRRVMREPQAHRAPCRHQDPREEGLMRSSEELVNPALRQDDIPQRPEGPRKPRRINVDPGSATA